MKRLDSIQALRALAALLVVFCHGAGEILTSHPTVAPGVWRAIHLKGLFGVDIFFIVSGFVMMYIITNQQSNRATSVRFLGDRIIRLVPLYWAATLLSVLIGVALPALKHEKAYSASYVIRSLLFLPSVNPSSGAPQPVLGLGWTLNYEMFFYVVLSLLLLLGVQRLWLALLVVFSSLVALGAWFAPEDIVLRGWSQPIILEFMFGVLLAQAWLNGIRANPACQILLVCAGVIAWLLIAPPTVGHVDLRGLTWGLPAAAIFAGVAMGRHNTAYPKAITVIGDASFSLYLTHLFVMRASTLLMHHLPVSQAWQTWFFVIVFPPAAVAFSMLSYRKFELPTMRWGRQALKSHLTGAPKPERVL